MKKFNLWGFIFISFVSLIVIFTLLTKENKTESVQHRMLHTSYDEYNCEDFDTWEQAQEVFESAGGVENDVHRLDRDGDGIACEALR